MERYKEVGLLKEEYDHIVEVLGREPNNTELAIFGVMWSEHCSYKNSKAMLKLFYTDNEAVLQGPGENAGIVDIGDDIAIAMKIESHNHPSAVEPFQGAATGVGGIIRDVFAMGAKPIALLNSIRFGNAKNEKTKKLLDGVVKGISHYGNKIGIPDVAGETVFNDSYNDNPLVNAMCVGILKKDEIKKGSASGVGNSVLLVGHTTGRDGIGGASFASENLTEESDEKRSHIQVGDPFMEKLLSEASLELAKCDGVVGVQDLGAAGLTSSSCEMASRAGTGVEIDISKVITREPGMTAREIMLSESQERMLAIIENGKEDNAYKIFKKWGLHAVKIGTVTDDGMVRIKNKDKVEVNVPARALADESPTNYRPFKRPEYLKKLKTLTIDDIEYPSDLNKTFKKLMISPNICSKELVYKQYDHMVGTNTVVKPGTDSAVLRIKESKKGIALSVDCNARYCYLDPYNGPKAAVCESARNVVASGGRPIAITDCLNYASPEDEEIYYQFRQSVFGITEACKVLDTPVISGNVSFYNQSNNHAIYPTPTIGMLGVLDDINYHTTSHFKNTDDTIILIGDTFAEIGGSEYLSVIHNKEDGIIPKVDSELEKRTNDAVLASIKSGKVSSAHDIADGGLGVALAESCFHNEVGCKIDINTDLREDFYLFSESQARYILSTSNPDEIINICKKYGIQTTIIGKVSKDDIFININNKNVIKQDVKNLKKAWKEQLECLMR